MRTGSAGGRATSRGSWGTIGDGVISSARNLPPGPLANFRHFASGYCRHKTTIAVQDNSSHTYPHSPCPFSPPPPGPRRRGSDSLFTVCGPTNTWSLTRSLTSWYASAARAAGANPSKTTKPRRLKDARWSTERMRQGRWPASQSSPSSVVVDLSSLWHTDRGGSILRGEVGGGEGYYAYQHSRGIVLRCWVRCLK